MLAQRLADAQAKQALRRLTPYRADPQQPHHWLKSTQPLPLLNMASNDYLGYGQDARWQTHLAQGWAVLSAEQRLSGVASPLVCGYSPLQQQLEAALAQWLSAEAALVFPSGYQANVALLAALVSPQSHVFADKLNHASLVDALKLAGNTWHRYPHNNMPALERLLQRHALPQAPHFIVSDTVFSMDGDVAPLAELASLAQHYNAVLVLDEAHACGVLGKQGAGAWSDTVAEHPHLAEVPVLRIGTLSKALAGHGAFIATSQSVIDWLVTSHRGLIYSTALSPYTVWANLQTLTHLRQHPQRQTQLATNTAYMQQALHPVWEALGQTPPMQTWQTPIVPIILGDSQRTLAVASKLQELGVLCPAIRPPTVPQGQARLRLCVSAGHSQNHLSHVANCVLQAVNKVN
jgi:8-amino-7-oxononanoate synthase